MSHRSIRLRCRAVLFGLGLCAALGAAADSPASPTKEAQSEARIADLTVLLDPEAEESARRTQIDALRAAAASGHHASICTLGRLALFGTRHAAKLPEVEYGDAAALLNRCILGGDLDAMLVMAERELREKRVLEAMIWVQAYFKLAAALEPDRAESAGAYKGGLLARIERVNQARHLDDEEVLEYVAGLLAKHGERIAAAHRAGGMQSWLPLPTSELPESRGSGRALLGRFARDHSDVRDSMTYANFLIEVDAEGKPRRQLVFEAYPDAEAGRRLRSAAIAARFAPSEDPAPRWTYFPVYVDDPSFKLTGPDR